VLYSVARPHFLVTHLSGESPARTRDRKRAEARRIPIISYQPGVLAPGGAYLEPEGRPYAPGCYLLLPAGPCGVLAHFGHGAPASSAYLLFENLAYQSAIALSLSRYPSDYIIPRLSRPNAHGRLTGRLPCVRRPDAILDVPEGKLASDCLPMTCLFLLSEQHGGEPSAVFLLLPCFNRSVFFSILRRQANDLGRTVFGSRPAPWTKVAVEILRPVCGHLLASVVACCQAGEVPLHVEGLLGTHKRIGGSLRNESCRPCE
jgi:hypothetical protein